MAGAPAQVAVHGGHVRGRGYCQEIIKYITIVFKAQCVNRRLRTYYLVQWQCIKWQLNILLSFLSLSFLNMYKHRTLFDFITRNLQKESTMFKGVDQVWKRTMETINKDPRVLSTAGAPGMLEELIQSLDIIQTIDQGINQYVEDKKLIFPRFFFLSNIEILKVLSETKDPTKVIPYCQKLFEGIHSLEFNEIFAIEAMVSPTNERVQLQSTIQPREVKGCVEKWLTELEEQMFCTLQQLIASAKETLPNSKQKTWAQDWPSQVILVVQHLLWTMDIQEAIKGGEQALKEQFLKLSNDVESMISYLKSKDLTESVFVLVKSLIIQQLHFKEVTEKVYRDKITSDNDFAWSTQIKMCMKDSELQLSMFNIDIPYRYEYIGSIKRLVMTPSTNQGILGLMMTFNLNFYGGIQGPCDVGKSSLAKELAAYVGTMYRTMTGSDRNTVYSVINFICGTVSSGCWGIIEDFDRASSGVLSYMSVLIDNLRQCTLQDQDQLVLDNGKSIPVEKGFFLMKTSHTSFIGRNKVPESMKVLFRPTTIIAPNIRIIIKNILISFGFKKHDSLSYEIEHFANLFNSQFSKRTQYHFGIRRIEFILELARNIINVESSEFETEGVKQAICEDLIPTLVLADIPIVESILSAAFGESNTTTITKNLQQEDCIENCFKLLNQHQSLMVIGPTFSGKTTILKAVAKQRNVEKMFIINPKSISKDQLFGKNGIKGWEDGMLSKTFQRILSNTDENWIIFDGPIDHNWIENLNSILDFKKLFYFDSGETFNISSSTKVLFECSNLDSITPATVSRCGMMSVAKSCLPWTFIFERWFEGIRSHSWMEGHDVLLKDLFEWIIPPLLKLLDSCKTSARVTENSLVKCSLDLFERILIDALPNLKERKYLRGWIQAAVVYGSIWSVGGCLVNEAERIKFDNGVREVIFGKSHTYPLPPSLNGKFDALPPVEGIIFDFVFDFKARGQWKHWNDVIKNYEIPEVYDVSNLLIPTIDSSRYSNILELTLKMNKPFMLIGPRGSGKSIYISNLLKNVLDPQIYESHVLNFTPSTTSRDVYLKFTSSLIKKKQGCFGTKSNKNLVMFIDSFELPLPDDFGDQTPNEFVHTFLDHKIMFDFEEFNECNLENTNIVCAANSNPGMNQNIPSRILRHFHAVSCTYPSDESLQKIFSTKLNIYFKTRSFQPEASGIVGPLVQSTIFIHNQLKKNMYQIKSKPHYIFNIRDVQSVIEGSMMMPKELSDNKKLFTRLWVHETLRTFNDKLTTPEDTFFLFEKIKHCVKVIFRENFDSAFEHLGKVDGFVTERNLRNLTFGNFVKVEDKLYYQEITSFEAFSKQTKQSLQSYFNLHPSKTFGFELLRYSMENISKICRILSQENGNMILLGEPGTGRELMTRVASIIKDSIFYSPTMNAEFTFNDWRNDFKQLLKEAGGYGKCCVLFLNPELMDYHTYIDDVNNFLTNYELPGLFSVEEMYEITAQVHNYLKESKESEAELTPTELYQKFKERCKANFHIILKVSLHTNIFTLICRKYPKILDSSTVCLFKQWPEDALKKASELFFEEIPISRDERNSIIACMIAIYDEILSITNKINTMSKHGIEVTPSSFIACIKYFSYLFQQQLSHFTNQKKLFDDIILKFDWIRKEIENLARDIADIHNQVKELDIAYTDLEKKTEEEKNTLHLYEKESLEEEKKVQNEQKVLNGVREICENEFREINGKIEECLKVLKTFSPSEFMQPCQLKKPNVVLKKTMAAICILLNIGPDMIPDPSSKKKDAEVVADYWGPSKRQLQSSDFIYRLEHLDKEDVSEECLQTIRNDYVNADLDPSALTKSTPVGEAICRWLKNVEVYITIDRANQDKKEDLKQAEIQFDEVKRVYYEKNTEVENQQDCIKEIFNQMQENKEKRKELLEESSFMNLKKSRGEDLLNILDEENQWWEDKKLEQEKYLETLLGNIVLVTTSMFYLAAFPEINRIQSKKIIEQILNKWKIAFSTDEFRQSMFVKDTDILQWELLGLPNVNYYISNALLLKISPRWPFLIDPTNQTVLWVQKLMTKRNIISIDSHDTSIVTKVERAVEEGTPILIENVLDEMDSNLYKLIRREYFYDEDKVKKVDIGGKIITVHTNFQMIFSSASEEIKFPSFFQTNLLLINCLSTVDGTIDSLRRMVMAKERPDNGQKTEYYIKRYCDTAEALNSNRNDIIKVLLNTDGNILDNESACTEIKNHLANIKTSLSKKVKLDNMKKEIKDIIDSYLPIAKHAMAIFKTVRKLEVLNPLYKYSFDWYSSLFQSSIENSNKSKVLSKRVRYLCDHLTYNCFVQVTQSLYLKDKQIFSFMLCLDLMLFRQKITETDVKVLLCNAPEADIKNPCSRWLSSSCWDLICNLEQLDIFSGIIEDFQVNSKKWKIIYDSCEPDDLPFHQPWNARLTKLHKLMMIKVLRPDKLIEIFEAFIGENLGYKFVETVNADLGRILADSGPRTPVFLLLTENRHPIEIIRKLRVGRHGNKNSGLKILSLLNDQVNIITSTVEASIRDGSWVLIQNCHFCGDAKFHIQLLYSILLNTADINEDFRLWFTSESVPFLGTKVPGNSIKFVIEPPRDVKEQILDVLQNTFITKDIFETGVIGKEASFSKLLFSLIFLFIKSNGRNIYKNHGWSVKTLFNEVDIECAMHSLRDVLKLYEGANFFAIKFLLKHCNMINRIQDRQDKLLLEALLDDILREEVLTVNRFRLSDSPDVFVPNKVVYSDVLEAVKIIPQKSSNEVFNLGKLSQTKKDLIEADKLTTSLKVMYKLIVDSKDCEISELFAKIAEYNPDNINNKKHEGLEWNIQEEIINYKNLRELIKSQVEGLKLQLDGIHLLDPKSETLFNKLSNFVVPDDWTIQADIGLKDTTNFINKIIRNMDYLTNIDVSKGYDLSAFLDPYSLIEGAKMEFCKKEGLIYSSLVTRVSIHSSLPEDYIADHKGILFKDIQLHFASFNFEYEALDHCEEKSQQILPFLRLQFYDRSKVESTSYEYVYQCPLYLTSGRVQSNGTSSLVVHLELPSLVPGAELAKAGAALLIHSSL